MPVYEHYCEHCDGIFETLRPMSRASDAAACPVCEHPGERIMPTSFSAFTMRDGYPRRIPDKGTYWHLGKEVKKRARGGMRAWEHPEINKPTPPPKPAKGDVEIARQKSQEREKERRKIRAAGFRNTDRFLPKQLRPPLKRPGA